MTNRWGNPLSYSFSIPNGNYQVKILESENYWKAAGKRVFSISLQGSVVLANYDLFAATGGIDQAVTLTYTATVSTGTLSLVGNASADNAQFAAIQLTWLGPACSPSPTASPSFSVSPTISPTPSISPTFTVSPTFSVSPTMTATPTISPTFSVSPTFTVCPTVTPTGTVTPTFTATYTTIPFVGPLLILNGAGVPNPDPLALLVQLSRPADSISADFYSVSLTRVLQVRQENAAAGYNTLHLSQAWTLLPNGVYFVRVTAQLGSKVAPSRILKLIKLH